jgi:threonine/homoserine/homoserine lactone efflux protein
MFCYCTHCAKILQNFLAFTEEPTVTYEISTYFFIKCFALGVSSTFGLGPIFLLIINRATLYGFFNGLGAAFGAALADGIFFSLALLGVLNLFQKYQSAIVIAEIASGLAILLFGILMLSPKKNNQTVSKQSEGSIISTTIQAFLLTILSPFVAIFFAFASIQIVPIKSAHLSIETIACASALVSSGSFLGLTLIALTASSLRNAFNQERIIKIGFFSGLIFIATGLYLLGDSFYLIFLRK